MLILHGYRKYFTDILCIFDFGIVIISTIDIIITLTTSIELTTLNSLKALRLIRIFRIAEAWKTLWKLMCQTVDVVGEMIDFLILFMLFTFTFTLLGREWFAFKTKLNEDLQDDERDGEELN